MSDYTSTVSAWDVLLGRARLFGVDPAHATDRVPAGLIRPSLLKSSMGIGYLESEDEVFINSAGVRDKLALVLRFAFCSIFGLLGKHGVGPEHQAVFGVRFSSLSMREAVERIIGYCRAPAESPMRTVAFVNPDCLNKAYTDRGYHYLLGRTDLVLPDGSGLRLAAKMLGFKLKDNVNGTDLFPLLCDAAGASNVGLFLLGGLPGVAEKTAENVCKSYPGLRIAGTANGFDDMTDTDALIEAINHSGADILLLGLGAPVQERWLHENADRLKVRVGLGVGGLFDYYSGNIQRAPVWLRELGLEWVWRILQEPSAKWKRYVIGNPLFIYRVARERWQRVTRNPGMHAAPASAATATDSRRANATARTRLWQGRLLVASLLQRALDVSVSFCGLLALSPVLLITAIAIRLESRGPIFFSQTRVGKRGRHFTMYKFRSMYVDAEQRLADIQSKNESADGVIFKMKRDPRVTRVGSIIRRLSIDELPQILNVFKGDMAVVGPRPALPAEVAQYNAEQRKRLQCKPGLTCLWQIGGRSDLSFKQQVELDLHYLSQQSLGKDIEIIARTVPAVLGGKGAY